MAAVEETERLALEEVEVRLLTEGIYRHYGFDFRDYSLPSLRRRIWKRVYAEGLSTISGLQEKVLHDGQCMERLLLDLSINTTAMFRDPTFYAAFRQKVVPLLRTYPFARIWHAGCSTGEEVYSMAILLQEEGLYERCRIYATDINEAVLQRAKDGIFPLASMQENTSNYIAAGHRLRDRRRRLPRRRQAPAGGNPKRHAAQLLRADRRRAASPQRVERDAAVALPPLLPPARGRRRGQAVDPPRHCLPRAGEL